MIARYLRDLLKFRDVLDLKKSGQDYVDTCMAVNHRTVNARLYKAALCMTMEANKLDGLFEIGSTLFGLIDEVDALLAVRNEAHTREYLKKIRFIGTEISSFMNRTAEVLHPDGSTEAY
ncbi:hypothetical protein AB9F26_04810 [Falsihalocynthiibacter sp. BN13B15]|uniref:hypothetical protein n=1 Tax=Falsihalocynthiibacter sp. BN13B15 TaxID=3240871 RepID=UPI0035101842